MFKGKSLKTKLNPTAERTPIDVSKIPEYGKVFSQTKPKASPTIVIIIPTT